MTEVTEPNAAAEGWTFLSSSSKYHYYRYNLSLCGEFALMYPPRKGFLQGNEDSRSNCSVCKGKRRVEVSAAVMSGD